MKTTITISVNGNSKEKSQKILNKKYIPISKVISNFLEFEVVENNLIHCEICKKLVDINDIDYFDNKLICRNCEEELKED